MRRKSNRRTYVAFARAPYLHQYLIVLHRKQYGSPVWQILEQLEAKLFRLQPTEREPVQHPEGVHSRRTFTLPIGSPLKETPTTVGFLDEIVRYFWRETPDGRLSLDATHRAMLVSLANCDEHRLGTGALNPSSKVHSMVPRPTPVASLAPQTEVSFVDAALDSLDQFR
jgi:hypothetical protein